MSKPLVFQFQGARVEYQMNKVDRARLYGYQELEVIDEDGVKCELGTLAEDDHTLLGKGGTGMGNLSADGLWCDKTQLRPVDAELKDENIKKGWIAVSAEEQPAPMAELPAKPEENKPASKTKKAARKNDVKAEETPAPKQKAVPKSKSKEAESDEPAKQSRNRKKK